MNNQSKLIKQNVRDYYTQKVITYGSIPKGVDWNSLESQELRFEQLLKICNPDHEFTINDYGCGYGYLVEFMAQKKYPFTYQGYDLSSEMIQQAIARYRNLPNCQFYQGETFSEMADYTIASGIFNVKLDHATAEWKHYIEETLHHFNSLSRSGFSFNILTQYSDPEYRREDLYYADPCFYFDFCKRNFSHHVALLHDYGLYEFTILVRKNV
jgi:SAM-dependent methyltransferase